MGEARCGVYAPGDGRTKQNPVLAFYKRRYSRSGAILWCPVALMYDIEHDFSISRICVDWIEMVKRLEDVIIISYVRAGSEGDRKNA